MTRRNWLAVFVLYGSEKKETHEIMCCCMCSRGICPTRLSWDCSSICRDCRVRLSSLISLRELWSISVLVDTCLFSSSNWRTLNWTCSESYSGYKIIIWNIWSGFLGNRPAPPHLDLVPGVHIAAVLLSDALILRPDHVQDLVQVLLRLGVHLHVHRAGIHLIAQGCKLLQAEQQLKARSKVNK